MMWTGEETAGRPMRLVWAIAALMMLGAGAACDGPNGSGPTGLPVPDDEAPDPTEMYRVVTFAPMLSALVEHVEMGEAIVGVADEDPRRTRAGVTGVGPIGAINAEAVLALDPTTVIAVGDAGDAVLQRLRESGVDVLAFPMPNSIAELSAMLGDEAALTGVESTGGVRIGSYFQRPDPLISPAQIGFKARTDLLRQIAEFDRSLEGRDAPKVLLVSGVNESGSLQVLSRDSLLSDLLNYANGFTVAPKVGAMQAEMGQTMLLARSPELVLVVGEQAAETVARLRPLLADIEWIDGDGPEVRTEPWLGATPERIVLTHSPVDLVAQFATTLHPDAAATIEQVRRRAAAESSAEGAAEPPLDDPSPDAAFAEPAVEDEATGTDASPEAAPTTQPGAGLAAD